MSVQVLAFGERAQVQERSVEAAVGVGERGGQLGAHLRLLRGERERARLVLVHDGDGDLEGGRVGGVCSLDGDVVDVVRVGVGGRLEVGRAEEGEDTVVEAEVVGIVTGVGEDDGAALGVDGAVPRSWRDWRSFRYFDAGRPCDDRDLVDAGDGDGDLELAGKAGKAVVRTSQGHLVDVVPVVVCGSVVIGHIG